MRYLYAIQEKVLHIIYIKIPLLQKKIENSTFIKELRNGTLPRVALEYYRKQDRIYLLYKIEEIHKSNKFLGDPDLESYILENITPIKKEIEDRKIDSKNPIQEVKNYMDFLKSFTLNEGRSSDKDKLMFYLSLIPCA